MSPTGQLTFIGVAGDAFVVDVIPTARQVWLGISLDLDGTESVVTLRVEAPVYDHSLTITGKRCSEALYAACGVYSHGMS